MKKNKPQKDVSKKALANCQRFFDIQWGWGITGQSCLDWLKMTSSRTSKPKSGGLSRFETLKIGGKLSDELVLREYLFNIS